MRLPRAGMITVTLLVLTALLLASPDSLPGAELKVAGVFSQNAVLQRDKPVPVWGCAEAGVTVTVEFGGQKTAATADAGGRWQVLLDPLPASATTAVMTVSAPPMKPVSIGGIVVGDVLLCAGRTGLTQRGQDEDAAAEPPSAPVRVFMMGEGSAAEPQRDAKGRWMLATIAAVKSLSALAYHVGRQLAAERNVPVGVICVTGTYAIESWMSRETLTATPEAKPVLDYYQSAAWKNRTVGTYEQRLAAWLEMQRKLPLNPPPKPKPDDVDILPKQEPSGIWNACLAPLMPAALSGIVWDAGEDWGSQSRAFQHGQLLPVMIASWRSAFGDAELPVAIVETRPHRYAVPFGLDGRLAAELREAQRAAANKAQAHIVTTIDLAADPTAREVAPGIVDVLQGRGRSGPVLAGSQTQGDKVILRFTETRGGLQAKGGELRGFAIAWSMFRWVWADARIQGDTVALSAPGLSKPDGVRYAYEDLPSRGATLTDAEGTPSAPFRTDTHLSVTGLNLDPAAEVLRYNPRADLGIEDPRLPRVLIIGDSISGHYLPGVRSRMQGQANVIGESSMTKGTWASMGPRFYRTDTATKGDDLKRFLAERGPFDIVHFNIGIHMFSGAQPGDEKPYAEKLRQVVATIRESGAVCLFANSTGTVADNTIPRSPRYLTNCRVFNAAAEAVMKELNVPVTDIHGLIQPRIKELISADLIHTNKEADEMMADLIAKRLTETLATMKR